MANIDVLKNYKHVHMIGIGGVSMSGIAEMLKNWGIVVTGTDANFSPIIRKLQATGLYVRIGSDFENLSHNVLMFLFVNNHFLRCSAIVSGDAQ